MRGVEPRQFELLRQTGRRAAATLAGGRSGSRFTRPEWLVISLSLLFATFLIVDPAVLQAVRDYNDATRSFFRSFTDLGKSGWILIPTGLACIALYLYNRREDRRRYAAASGLAVQLTGFLFVAVAGTSLAGSLMKNVIGRARPKLFDELGPVAFEPFSFTYNFASFPSGHATTICAFAGVLAIFWPKARVYVIAAACWIAATRFLIGSHFFSDVAGGALLGFAGAYWLRDRLAARRWLFERRDGDITLRAPLLRAWGKRRAGALLLPRSDSVAQRDATDL